jgi:hypothetical protein
VPDEPPEHADKMIIMTATIDCVFFLNINFLFYTVISRVFVS